jgi:hypothetical protein
MNNNINFKELRLDNYICINNNLHPCRVKEITMSSVVVESIKENYSEPTINSMNPIPLTEEWLIKFGFEKPAHSWNGKIFHLSQWDAYPLNWCVAMDKNGAVIVRKLKYVHQLQNLYFALTNEELTIM